MPNYTEKLESDADHATSLEWSFQAKINLVKSYDLFLSILINMLTSKSCLNPLQQK